VLVALQAFAVSCASTIIALPGSIWLLRRVGAFDHPNIRSSHVEPTPRGGGVALLAGITVAVVVSGMVVRPQAVLVGVAVVLGALGLVDDLRGTSPLLRLIVTMTAGLVVSALLLTSLSGPAAVAAVFLGGLWVTSFTNSFNFMDGVNGISGASGGAIGAGLWWLAVRHGSTSLAVVAAAVSGACLGFLPFNAWRARAFLGDVGSYGLGGVLAALAVALVQRQVAPTLVVLPFLPYLADTGVTIVRRLRAGERFYEAHRQHAYQRLTDRGWSHGMVASSVAAATVACGGLAVSADGARVGFQALAVAVAGCVALTTAFLPELLSGAEPLDGASEPLL
jgi:UDP-N-acetylmuramyl pentapeptide phosphotransferase/UDP-N-acetylglucosamine-1-phosphate transferase